MLEAYDAQFFTGREEVKKKKNNEKIAQIQIKLKLILLWYAPKFIGSEMLPTLITGESSDGSDNILSHGASEVLPACEVAVCGDDQVPTSELDYAKTEEH